MTRPSKVTSTFSVPMFGVAAEWTPSNAEREAAWELLVEIVTRTTVTDLEDDEGSDRDALKSLHSLFDTTRQVLRDHGPDTASDPDNGNLSFATIALRLLNDVLRPFLTRWHPVLDDDAKSIEVGQADDEAIRLHDAFRSDLHAVRSKVREYVFVLGRASGATHFAAEIDTAVKSAAAQESQVFATVEAAPITTLLGQPRRHMTRWLAPSELLGSLRRLFPRDDRDSALSSGSAQRPCVDDTFADASEFWFDYAADMGDAFDPTMQVAWLAGRRELLVGRTAGTAQTKLQRGQILVLGGDEVYPYATPKIFRNQLDTPFAVALQEPCNDRPRVFAIPGNHDWYGSLAEWRKRFTSPATNTFPPKLDATVSPLGWEVTQSASWFAAKLPHGWWIWGLDTYLDGSINQEQRNFFESIQLEEGDRVILCTPVPAWRMREKHPEQLLVLDEFVESCIEAKLATARVFLSGDSHVFASFTRRPQRTDSVEHHITSGGAGAFLQPTHNLASVVPQTDIPSPAGIDPAFFVDGQFWPPPRATHEIITGNAVRQVVDRQSPGLLGLLTGMYLLYAWGAGHDARGRVTENGWWSDLGRTLRSMVIASPGCLATSLLVLLFVAVGVGAARPNTKETRVVRFARRAGALHGALHAAAFFAIAATAHMMADLLDLANWVGLWAGASIAALTSTAIMMVFLSRVNRHYRVNDNEAFSFRHLTDGKHFIRCHIDDRGALTLRLIAMDRTHKGWAEAIGASQPLPPGFRDGPRAVARIPWQKTIGHDLEPLRLEPDQNRWIAISISNPPDVPTNGLNNLAGQIADTVLALGCHLAYGGDARQYGFTEQFAQHRRLASGAGPARVRNYRAANTAAPNTKGDLAGIEEVLVSEPADLPGQLTAMRATMAQATFARIVLGGRTSGYQGNEPGIVEEARLSMEENCPVYVLAAFGGAAAQFKEELEKTGRWKTLANGLSADDNEMLASTKDPHRIIHFLVRGLTEAYRRTAANEPLLVPDAGHLQTAAPTEEEE